MSALATVAGVTCVVPAFNAALTIDAALGSLLAQRTDLALEVIVVDDGSSDGTAARAQQWQRRFEDQGRSLRVVTQQNGGAARARNAGIAAATYDWILTQDADDTSNATRVEAMCRAADARPNARTTLFGSQFTRCPADSTTRYAAWANTLSAERLQPPPPPSCADAVPAPRRFRSAHRNSFIFKMKSCVAVFLHFGFVASVSAELNVAQMLILNDRAKNNDNTTASVLGESITGKARATLPSFRSSLLARLLARTG